jgi:hypothetical protein
MFLRFVISSHVGLVVHRSTQSLILCFTANWAHSRLESSEVWVEVFGLHCFTYLWLVILVPKGELQTNYFRGSPHSLLVSLLSELPTATMAARQKQPMRKLWLQNPLHMIAGAEYGVQCFCDNAIYNGGVQATNQADCNIACSGDKTEMCGGGSRMTLCSIGMPIVYAPPAAQKSSLPAG